MSMTKIFAFVGLVLPCVLIGSCSVTQLLESYAANWVIQNVL